MAAHQGWEFLNLAFADFAALDAVFFGLFPANSSLMTLLPQSQESARVLLRGVRFRQRVGRLSACEARQFTRGAARPNF
jgi:hypothetical protein